MNKEKLTMITLFSGTGMQERGFQDSNLFDLEIIGTSDIDVDATLSYAAVHCGLTPEMISTYDFPDIEEMAQYLTERKIGWDFQKNKGKDWFTYKKGKKLEDLKKYYLASVLQNNYGDISSIKELPYADFWFYSSCCQDLSVAGKMQGMKKGSGTRSGLLWEVERLLEISVNNGTQPKYLCLENVKNMVGKQFKSDFDLWLLRLEELGYNTYYKVLNAKYCGIPQNRERVFALSIRKDIDTGNFTFPQPFDNGLRLKDIIENNVEEKYYINTERAANLIRQLVDKGQLKGQRACADSTIMDPNTREISNCITARYDASIQNKKQIGLVVCEPNAEQKRLGGMFDDDKGKHQAGSVCDTDGLAPTLDTMQGGYREPCIVENADEYVKWKKITDFPYAVSNTGLVQNLVTGQLLNPSLDKDGYYYVTLHNDYERKNKRISRLVAEAFIPNPNNLPQVNHINGDIHNNYDTNLEWISNKDNCEHRDNVLLSIKKQGEPKGVSWDSERNKWFADMKYKNKTVHLGRFDDKKDAYRAVYYKYIELRGYAPWDENKYHTFSNKNELFEEYDLSSEISQRVNDYTTKPIYLGNTTPSGKSQCNAVYSTDGVSQTLCAGTHGYATGNILEESQTVIEIAQATKQGYIECVIPGVADLSYPNSKTRRGRVQEKGQICPTITATETGVHYIESLYRIRKLTPNECWALMGLKKEDCIKAANLGLSNSSLYKIAGNGIVTNCIELIAEHLYKSQYDPTYICIDEKIRSNKIHNILLC